MNREELRIAQEEAQRTLDKQVRAISDIDEKAVRIFRLDVLIISLIIAASSITIQSTEPENISYFVNGYMIVGVAMLLLSALLASITYSVSSVRSGVSHRDIERIIDRKHETTEFYEKLLRSYAKWIHQNYLSNTRSALLYTSAFLTTILAMGLLILGIVISLISVLFWIPVAVVFVGGAVLIAMSGINSQIRRLLRLRWEIDSRAVSPVFDGQNISKGRIPDEDRTDELAEEPEEEEEPEEDIEVVEAEDRDEEFEGGHTMHEPYENLDRERTRWRQAGSSGHAGSRNRWLEAVVRGAVTGIVRGTVSGIMTVLLNKVYVGNGRSQEEDRENNDRGDDSGA